MIAGRAIVSPRGEDRLDAAREWLLSHGSAEEILVVGPSLAAARELLLGAVRERGAAFGWRRTTPGLLAEDLAAVGLATAGRAPASALGAEAIIARVVSELEEERALGHFARVVDTPGFVRALADTLSDLRGAGLPPERVRPAAPELAEILERYRERLAGEGLADRAEVRERATAVARDPETEHPLLGLPVLFLDLAVHSEGEASFLAAVAARAPELLVTLPRGETRGRELLEDALREREVAWARGDGEPGADRGFEPRADAADGDRGPRAAGAEGDAELRALERLRLHLFEGSGPAPGGSGAGLGDTASGAHGGGTGRDDSLVILSAPGESRECVEIARKILQLAADGVPFDGMAVLLRSPEEYRAHLQEAFSRAGIPAHFERGLVLPDPGGRAFLALLRCRAEGYSAKRFAEYLSLGEVPEAGEDGGPPGEAPSGDRWVAPDREGRAPRSASAEINGDGAPADASALADPEAPVVQGTLRTPRRWEELIVEASVVGGLDRWRRRLGGLRAELEAEREALEREEDPGARTEKVARDLRDLAALRTYALPLLETLEELPASAPWGEWLDRLSALASRSLRAPGRVLSLLAELAPLAPVGSVDLSEVIRVLSRHLLELSFRPEDRRFGRVLVASTEGARGRSFRVVFVPGLAERLFPKEIREDPVLLDAARKRISPRLPVNDDRVATERLALRLACGAATERAVLSYPRMDLSQHRPRVPSFYALEVLRAAEGRLPLFEELRERADAVTEARVGWPAPRTPDEAIDAAEYDLAVLERIHGRPILGARPASEAGAEDGGGGMRGGRDGGGGAQDGRDGGGGPRDGRDGGGARDGREGGGGPRNAAERNDAGGEGQEAGSADHPGADHTGAAHYLLTANPHLGRALRARAYRWIVQKWSPYDGLVRPSEEAAEVLARHRFGSDDGRPTSATALQNFATCPYKYYLSAVHRLEPREVPEPIESLDPLQRGSLVHDTMFQVFSRLEEEDLLPVREDRLESCLGHLDAALDQVAAEYRERLVPAIDRVWEDGIEAIRADLRRWLRDVARADDGWVPWRFELSFGVPRRAPQDPHSRTEPATLDAGVRVRGAIDLVERRADGALRVTDYKTGKVRVTPGAVVDGGRHVQPVLYPLALEKLVPGARVVSGRLYYCTADGGFHVHEVPLSQEAREAMESVVELVGRGIEDGFLPAAPDEGACRWCDYRPVCGPWEERRTRRKGPVPALRRLRELR